MRAYRLLVGVLAAGAVLVTASVRATDPLPGCVTDPRTPVDILNACTDTERVDKQPALPYLHCDGSLPALGSALVPQHCASTTTTLPTTVPTSTTLPTASCTAPTDCPDGDACSTKDCQAGRCVATPFVGVALADCRLGLVVAPGACGGDTIDKGLTKTLVARVGQARGLLGKVSDPSSKKGRKRVKQAVKMLTGLGKRVGKAKHTPETCRTTLEGLIADPRTVLTQLLL